MKKLFSIVLATMLVLMATVPAFAAESSSDFPKTGVYHGLRELNGYIFEAVDYGHSLEKLPLDKDTENQIKEDYLNSHNLYDYTIDDVSVDYYGTLSDGTMLVFPDCSGIAYATVVQWHVVGKYGYVTGSSGTDVILYKNHEFRGILSSYEDGSLSDEMLDEVADKLCFAIVKKPGDDSTQSTTKSVATADTAINNNNANDSIPTGQNSALLYTMLITLVSAGVVAVLVKRKKS